MTHALIDSQRVRPVSAGRTSFYRLPVDRPESLRQAEARERAQQRLRRQRDTLRPLGLVVIFAVAIGAINGHPAPTSHGAGLGVAAALVVFAAALAVAVRGNFIDLARSTQGVVIAAMGAAGVALTALQPHGATELAGGAATWMAIARFPFYLGWLSRSVITVGIALAEVLTASSASVVLAAVLLCVLLALVAYFIKQARASQNTTELLLAQLEDAREEQLQAAAISERSRIASELHDVLAHALSGAAIQLQGARKLAEHEQASAEIRAAIERASDLVRDGLANARQAVGALRGDELLGISQLEALVATFKNDMNTEVTLTVNGSARPLPSEAGLALYRGAQEALTNIARYAPGATTTVLLHYGNDHTSLTIEDRLTKPPSDDPGLADVGGGNGLAGMRERLERAGGRMQAGPTETGWRVELEVPA